MAALLALSCTKNASTTGPEGGSTTVDTGIPLGVATTAPIGTAGGVVGTSDGAASVSIPAGALNTTVQIGVQPISNGAPLGFGTGVRFTPSGLKFAGPATVTFNFSGGPAPGNAPSLSVAFQDSTGAWQAVGGSSVDTTSQSVTFPTTHFSDYVLFERFRLEVDREAILENETATFRAVRIGPDDLNPLAGGTRLTSAATVDGGLVSNWRLNGIIAPGNVADGQMAVGAVKSIGVYTAPATAPDGNTVGVTCEVTVLGGQRKLTLAARVNVGSSVSFQFGRGIEQSVTAIYVVAQGVPTVAGSDTTTGFVMALPSAAIGTYPWSSTTTISIIQTPSSRITNAYVTSYENPTGGGVTLMPGAVRVRSVDASTGLMRGEFSGTMTRFSTVGGQTSMTPVFVSGRFVVRRAAASK
jgi:hypothetical protein